MDNIDLGSINNMRSPQGVEPSQRKVQKESSPPPQGDEVKISQEGSEAAAYVENVKKMDPVRPAVVEEMRGKMKGGNYLPPALIDGMVALVGNSLRVEGKKS